MTSRLLVIFPNNNRAIMYNVYMKISESLTSEFPLLLRNDFYQQRGY